jgi:hypothetical protein
VWLLANNVTAVDIGEEVDAVLFHGMEQSRTSTNERSLYKRKDCSKCSKELQSAS